MSPMRAAMVVTGAFVLAACRKPAPPDSDPGRSASGAGVSAPSARAADPRASDTVLGLVGLADVRFEARRGKVSPSDPMLDAHRTELGRQFQPIPPALRVQVARVGPNASAALVEAPDGDPRPLLWLVTDAGDITWEKSRPMGGVKPGATEPVVAPGPEERIALAWCNAATTSVALRQWTREGAAFADFEALRYDTCDALSLLYWPRHGWLVGVANQSGLILQLVGPDGDTRWGREGQVLPWTWRAPAAAAFGLDTEDTFLLFRFGASGGPGSPEYVFAARHDGNARPLWPGPVSVLKLSGPVSDPGERLVLLPGPSASIRVKVSDRLVPVGSGEVVSVKSDGTVLR